MKNWRALLLCLAGAVIVATLVLVATRESPGITVDSAEYLGVGQGLADGHGLTMPYLSYDEPYPEQPAVGERVRLTQFPPGYPIALGIGAWLSGASSTDVSRALNAGLCAVTTVALLGLIRRRRAFVLLALLGIGLLLMPFLFGASAMAWSEPLMWAATMMAIVTVGRYLETKGGWWLAATCVAAGVAASTRFVGLFLAVGLGIVLAARGASRGTKAIELSALFGTLGLTTGAWFLRNVVVIGAASEKSLVWHPPGTSDIEGALSAASRWLTGSPSFSGRVLATIVLLVIAAAAVQVLRPVAMRFGTLSSSLLAPVHICAVLGVVYLAVLVGARTLVDANISFDVRHLCTPYLLAVAAITTSIDLRRRSGLLSGLAAAVLAASFVPRTADLVSDFPDSEVAGYIAERWDESPTLAWLERNTTPDTVVISNAPDAIQLHLDRQSLFLPLRTDIYTERPNGDYRQQLEGLRRAVRGRTAVVAFFRRPTRGGARRMDDEVAEVLQLESETALADGGIYAVARSEPG